jgi:hypothetical protein
MIGINSIAIKRVGIGQFYLISIRDTHGAP